MRKVSRFMWAMFFLAGAMPALAHTHETQATPVPQSESLFNITDDWTTSDGKPFQLHELGGNPSVIAMIYTSCRDICPLIVADMKKIERHLPATQVGKVHFAVFSFDPERDTSRKLKEYAQAHGIDTPSWVVASGKPEAVRRLAVALGMKYKKTRSGDFEHGVSIYILDDDGVVRHVQTSLGQDGEAALAVLKGMAH
jgi:protein SCO1